MVRREDQIKEIVDGILELYTKGYDLQLLIQQGRSMLPRQTRTDLMYENMFKNWGLR